MAKYRTLEEVAGALGVSRRTLSRRIETGSTPFPDAGEDGAWDSADVEEWAETEAPAEEGSALERERTRRTRAQADREELRLARERGEVVPVEVYRADLLQLAAIHKAALATLENRLSLLLANTPEVIDAARRLIGDTEQQEAAEVEKAFAEVASGKKAGDE